MKNNLVEIKNLKKYFPVERGFWRRTKAEIKALNGVNLSIESEKTLGLVGESGCGKTTLGKLILKLLEPTGGEVLFSGRNIFRETDRQTLAEEIQIIFQDPFGSLNPRHAVEEIVGESLVVHRRVKSWREKREKVKELLRKVGLNPDYIDRYPHQFSGGERQRVGIARALALAPRLIVADEPVSSLDVSVQAQILNLLKDLQAEFNLTFLFIAHNLEVVRWFCDRVAVMYLGKIVEIAPGRLIFQEPLHPYTEALASAAPVADPGIKKKRIILKGEVSSAIEPPSGCPFHPRCFKAIPKCSEVIPEFEQKREGRWVSCHLVNRL